MVFRIWIIQEITLAKNAKILVGKDEISRADFLSATALICQSNLGSLTDVSVAQVGRTLQIWDDYHASVMLCLVWLRMLKDLLYVPTTAFTVPDSSSM